MSFVNMDIQILQAQLYQREANGYHGNDNHQRSDAGASHGLSW
jgi:hypothetical protein